MEKVYYIYLHIRKDNGKIFYVGKGTDNGKLTYERSKSTERNLWWKNIVKKTDFDIKIVFTSKDEIKTFDEEKKLIKEYGRKDLGLGTLVNLTDGGEGMENPSELTRKKLSESRKGEKNHNFGKSLAESTKQKLRDFNLGKKLPIETCQKMSASRTGKKHPMFNKTHSEKSRKKMSIAKKGKEPVNKGQKVTSVEVLQKISESGKGRKWINNGSKSITAKDDTLTHLLNNGWVLGRLISEEQKTRLKSLRIGLSSWNKGKKNTGGGRPKGSKNKIKTV
jgi:hypothetical protein